MRPPEWKVENGAPRHHPVYEFIATIPISPMQNPLPPNTTNNNTNEEEISLADVVQFLQEGKYWIISIAIACTLLGAVYAFLSTPKYEATANIEMASVAGTVIEAPNILGEKLKFPLYYSTDTYKACDVENEFPSPGQFLAAALMPVVSKNAPIVSIKFRAESISTSKKCLESVLSDVKKSQGILSKPMLDKKNSQLQMLLEKLEGVEKVLAQLPVGNKKFDFNDSQFSATALLLTTSLVKESEVSSLRNQISELQISLTEPQTRDTNLVTPIYASSKQVEPKRALVIVSSAIGGILLGLLFWAGRKFLSSQGGRSPTGY